MKTEFLIRDLSSEHDATSVREMLEDTAGVERADVSFDDRKAEVEFDSTTVPVETLMKKIADLGFGAVESKPR
jgi:copper chaperone CopZ